MEIIKLFIRRPIFTSMLVVALLVFGIFSLPKIGVDLFPNIDIPIITNLAHHLSIVFPLLAVRPRHPPPA